MFAKSIHACAVLSLVMGGAIPAAADAFSFSNGDPDGRMATASRPDGFGGIEIESADDFAVGTLTAVKSATFTGLLPSGASLSSVGQVTVEIYRVSPKDSTDPPSGNVPTRGNSPSDVAFDSRSTADGNLSMSAAILSSSFTASNSVLNGINPIPNQNTLGEGPVTGEEVEFTVNFTTPFFLPADHYFFVPQVGLSSGNFFWLSTARPNVPPATVFSPDLQEWIRNGDLDPDWLRVGADIVGTDTFNTSFSLAGNTIPEPSTLPLLGGGLLAVATIRKRWSS